MFWASRPISTDFNYGYCENRCLKSEIKLYGYCSWKKGCNLIWCQKVHMEKNPVIVSNVEKDPIKTYTTLHSSQSAVRGSHGKLKFTHPYVHRPVCLQIMFSRFLWKTLVILFLFPLQSALYNRVNRPIWTVGQGLSWCGTANGIADVASGGMHLGNCANEIWIKKCFMYYCFRSIPFLRTELT